MSGFRNVKAWADAADGGANWLTSFRKTPPSAATIAGQWYDYSGASGGPPANFFASNPMVAATLDGNMGIRVPSVSPAQQYIQRVTLMTAASGATSTSNQRQGGFILDYLMYYPFIDLDAVGEEQVFENPIELPRYADGLGVKMLLLSQAPTLGGGQFTIKYDNCADAEVTTPNQYCVAAQPAGCAVSATANANGATPFVPFASPSCKGVKRAKSITMTVANGGLVCLVLAKPIMDLRVLEECRRTTTGNLESYGAADEVESISRRSKAPQIIDGCFLSLLMNGAAGSLASAPLVGVLETVWE